MKRIVVLLVALFCLFALYHCLPIDWDSELKAVLFYSFEAFLVFVLSFIFAL